MDAVELIARELVTIKLQIGELSKKQEQFKAALLPLIQERKSVDLENGRVYYGESQGARSFRRNDVLRVIEDNFGAEVAKFIDDACTNIGQPRQTVFVSLKLSDATNRRDAA